MANKVKVRANYRKDRGGWIIYFPKSLIEDSSFPLTLNESMVARIEKNKLIIEKE